MDFTQARRKVLWVKKDRYEVDIASKPVGRDSVHDIILRIVHIKPKFKAQNLISTHLINIA